MKLLHSVQGMGVRPDEIVVDERLDHLIFEALLEIDDVIRDAQMLRDVAGVVDVFDASSSGRWVSCSAPQAPAAGAGSRAAW